jgi:hypothetical protein
MNRSQSFGSSTTSRSLFDRTTESNGDSPAFVAWPMTWNCVPCCPTLATAQYALYAMACQQAVAAIEEIRRRRQMRFAAGVHLWN